MKKIFLSMLFFSSSAFAQVPFPNAVNVNGGWVPCSHPIAINAGYSCNTTTDCLTFRTATVCSLTDCQGINPYAQDDLATACAHWTLRLYVPPPTPVYRLGQTLQHAYPGLEAIVIGITKDLVNGEVLTLEVTKSQGNLNIGDVIAVRNTFSTPWRAK